MAVVKTGDSRQRILYLLLIPLVFSQGFSVKQTRGLFTAWSKSNEKL